jgi:hypothetical protein
MTARARAASAGSSSKYLEVDCKAPEFRRGSGVRAFGGSEGTSALSAGPCSPCWAGLTAEGRAARCLDGVLMSIFRKRTIKGTQSGMKIYPRLLAIRCRGRRGVGGRGGGREGAGGGGGTTAFMLLQRSRGTSITAARAFTAAFRFYVLKKGPQVCEPQSRTDSRPFGFRNVRSLGRALFPRLVGPA